MENQSTVSIINKTSFGYSLPELGTVPCQSTPWLIPTYSFMHELAAVWLSTDEPAFRAPRPGVTRVITVATRGSTEQSSLLALHFKQKEGTTTYFSHLQTPLVGVWPSLRPMLGRLVAGGETKMVHTNMKSCTSPSPSSTTRKNGNSRTMIEPLAHVSASAIRQAGTAG